MKHYVIRNEQAHLSGLHSETNKRIRNIDVILIRDEAKASAELIVEFFQALNTFADDHTYVVNIRAFSDGTTGHPLYWAGRTAIFWGDLQTDWRYLNSELGWAAQVLNLSSRTVLVSGAVLLLAQLGRSRQTAAAIHPNFAAAAREVGLNDAGTGAYLAADSRIHSASTRLSALRLLAEFVAMDHGEHMAESLRTYIGLTEPRRSWDSQLAVRLMQRSGADTIVRQAIEKMLENLEDPLKIPDLSHALGTSTRQLQRRFLGKTGAKLLTTYRELRLERAHSLLKYTDLSQREVSTATGFSSVTSMSRAFRTLYKTTPDTIRSQRFAGGLNTATHSG